jgi:signal transduction histidine kinase
MNIQEKIESIRKVDIFSETEEPVLSLIAGAIEEVKIRKGKQILQKGGAGDAMFIISSGKVRIHDGSHVLARLEENQAFGEYSLIDNETRSASVTADEACILLRLDRKDFFDIASGNPGVLRGALKVLIQRMRYMNELEEKLARSYLKIRKQKEKIEKQNVSIKEQKGLLEQQNYDLTRLNEEKNDLISILVHQIKNPLTSSLCLIEMLEQDDDRMDDKTRSESVRVIRQSLRRINNLVTEMLDLNAIDSKVYELKYEKLSPELIMNEIIDNYRYLLEQKGVSLNAELDSGEMELNRVYFTQIFDNLMSNAIKASPPGGVVEVEFKYQGNNAHLGVYDEGPGFSKEMLDSLFGQYQRQTTMEMQHQKPEGLGLAIIYKYTSAMGGTVNVKSTKGNGATFLISFPLRQSGNNSKRQPS